MWLLGAMSIPGEPPRPCKQGNSASTPTTSISHVGTPVIRPLDLPNTQPPKDVFSLSRHRRDFWIPGLFLCTESQLAYALVLKGEE